MHALRDTVPLGSGGELAEHLDAVRRGRLLLNRADQWLLSEVSADLGARVLEVGCGHGNLTSLLLDRELVVATDADPKSVRRVQDRFRDHANVRAHVFDATQPPSRLLTDYRVDTVISLNVLEHIEGHEAALENMLSLLDRNGTLILIVPAHMRLYGRMDVSIGHHRRYDKALMQTLLTRLGARIRRQFYHNIVGALGWWFAGRVLRCEIPPEGQLSVFNRLVPVLARSERIAKPPFGVSLVTVAGYGECLQ